MLATAKLMSAEEHYYYWLAGLGLELGLGHGLELGLLGLGLLRQPGWPSVIGAG